MNRGLPERTLRTAVGALGAFHLVLGLYEFLLPGSFFHRIGEYGEKRVTPWHTHRTRPMAFSLRAYLVAQRTGVLSHVFEAFEPWAGEIRPRATGVIVSDRSGAATTYAMINLQERAMMMVGPGTDVYCGMIVGENSRAGDMDVNICREKKLTNMRAAAADETVRLTPHRVLSLEHALEFIAADECIEVTPKNVRLRKVELDPSERGRAAKRASLAAANA